MLMAWQRNGTQTDFMKYRELTYGEVIKKSDKRKFFLWPASQRNLDRQRGIFAQLLWYYTMSDSYHSKNTPGNCCPSVHNSLDSQTYPHCTKPTARKLLQVSLILLSPVSDVTSLSKELLCHREAEANWPLLCQEGGRGRSVGGPAPLHAAGGPCQGIYCLLLNEM